jgi:hypothetical protein
LSVTSAGGLERKSRHGSRGDYERAFRLVLKFQTTVGTEVGGLAVASITAHAIDKRYLGLQKGKKRTRAEWRVRQANLCVIRSARAWDEAQRLYPQSVPVQNPFRGVELERGKGTTRPATRDEAYAVRDALLPLAKFT